jgi:aspartate aminotransferase
VEEWLGKSYGSEKLSDSRQIAAFLLEKEMLAVVPGIEFGLEGYLRLSFAASPKDLKRATERFKSFQSSLS